jgi:hypothetical protein
MNVQAALADKFSDAALDWDTDALQVYATAVAALPDDHPLIRQVWALHGRDDDAVWDAVSDLDDEALAEWASTSDFNTFLVIVTSNLRRDGTFQPQSDEDMEAARRIAEEEE